MVHLKEWNIQFHNHKVQDEGRKQCILIYSALRIQFLLLNLFLRISFKIMECRLGKTSE